MEKENSASYTAVQLNGKSMIRMSVRLSVLHGAGTYVQQKPLPNGIPSIQSASQKLHEALCGVWCCDDSAHRSHYAKLCVDVQVEEQVRLDLAISCYESNVHGDNR